MNSKIISAFAICLFLLSLASAMTVYSEFNDGSQSMTVVEGQSVTFSVDFFSMNPPINSMKVNLNSGSGSVYTFLNSNTAQKTYSETYTYFASTAGTYEITAIGKDRINTDCNTLKLKVTPKTNPTDTTKPIITVLGNNPATVYVGHSYTDAGATATDNVDGDITSRIHTTNSVNANTIGTYSVTYTVSDNAGNTASATRTVKVIANPNPVNHLPVITSTPETEVNEGESYSYQIEATDSDGDELTYSLTQNPSWLTISSTGLISGTAPSVDSDTSYPIGIRVSDGTGSVTQAYVLVVEDASSPGNLPTIHVISPTNKKYTKSVITFKVETDGDAVEFELDDGSRISMHGDDGVFTYTATLSDGAHTVIFYAINEYGQSTKTVDFRVKVGGSGGCGDGYTVTDYPSTPADVSDGLTGYSAVIANGNKNKNDNLILFYILIGVIGLGTLVTGYALIKKIVNKK